MSDDTTCPKRTSSAGGSPANLFRVRVNGKPKPIRVGSGRSSDAVWLIFDPATCLWKTSRDCCTEGWLASSVIFPRSGTLRNGIAYRRSPLVPLTDVTGSSLWVTPTVMDALGFEGKPDVGRTSLKSGKTLLGQVKNRYPTPTVGDSKSARNSTANRKTVPPTGVHKGDTLTDAVTKWPTPSARDWKSGHASEATHARNSRPLNEAVAKGQGCGQLNPAWVEWLMGFPLGWTDLEPSATP
jgi:hypothetical protein